MDTIKDFYFDLRKLRSGDQSETTPEIIKLMDSKTLELNSALMEAFEAQLTAHTKIEELERLTYCRVERLADDKGRNMNLEK